MRNASRIAAGCLSLFVLLAPMLSAQTIIGTWQATLPVPEAPRVQLKISRSNDGTLRGILDRLDWTTSIPCSTASFLAPDLNIAVAVVDITYRAKLNPDGTLLQGTWQDKKQSYALSFTLATTETLWKRDSALLASMASSANPAFEVATIKPSEPGKTQRSFALQTRHFKARNTTVSEMVKFAYAVRSRQIEDAPAWFDEVRFDIDAEPDTDGVPSEEQDRMMLKKLLADRFQLTAHIIQRVVPVYALTLTSKSPKLDPSEDSINAHSHIFVKDNDGQRLGQFMDFTMADFTDMLMNFIPERHIVDETGLKGRFDFTMTISTASGQNSGNDTSSEFFHAIEPLGFKLIPKKAAVDVIVIDRLEKPSEN